MFSWNGKKLVHPICTVGTLRYTFYFFTKTIHANDKYCCAEYYGPEEEFFGTLAQVPSK
jgi:hypothetical protein